MPDLANAMKYNPNLKVLLNAGYFDLATPFLRRHLRNASPADSAETCKAISNSNFTNPATWCTRTPPALKALHDNVAAFIHETETPKTK